MAHVNAFDTITLINEIIRNSSDPQTHQRYSSCTMDYTDVLLALSQAKESYSSGNYSDMNFNAAVVTKDVKDCDIKAYDSSQVRINNQYLADFSMIIMILSDFLAGKY
ncbi:pectinesterase inhibitor-like [Vigna umbellata]|uniref:pectinesterase inhibitor-like n=1 Tax=Vigna umbellata TaxID=87088 RepID=UPI001F5F5CE1|nr:pectinesterase inhibitor-like [Vigna umbellata]